MNITQSKLFQIIRDLLINSNWEVRNPAMKGKLYHCPMCNTNWATKERNELSNYEKSMSDYNWDRICKNCFEDFSKLDTIVMLHIFKYVKLY